MLTFNRHSVVATAFLLCCAVSGTRAKFRVIREWAYVNFTWPDPETYRRAIDEGAYVPQNNIVAGLEYFDDFYYVTLPRMRRGVPVTLARIPAGSNGNDPSPLLEPFPSWTTNELDNCDALQNVQNVEVDPKGQMWIIDGGRTATLTESPTVNCKPKLLVYDIAKMENVISYTFPEHVALMNGSFLYDIVLDNTDQGYAYITDNSGVDPGIIVFSVKDHQAWKIRHSQSMRADPNAAIFRVNDITINAPLNVAGIALGPRIQNREGRVVVTEDREVYYAPLSSFHLYSIDTSVLKKEIFAEHDSEFQGDVTDHGLKRSQSGAMVMDNKGVLYYGLLAVNSVAKWDSDTPFQTGQKIIAKDERFLEWPNSFTFDENGNLTILVNRLNRFIYGKLNISEPNYRLIASHVGGESYMYDDTFTYQTTSTTSSTTTTTTSAVSLTTTTEKAAPVIKPGTDQDPNLLPLPDTGREATPEQSTAKVVSTTTKALQSGAADRAAAALFSFLMAGALFVL